MIALFILQLVLLASPAPEAPPASPPALRIACATARIGARTVDLPLGVLADAIVAAGPGAEGRAWACWVEPRP